MPTVTLTFNATTIEFPEGNIRGPHRFDESNVVSQRLAGGAIAAYELSGLSALEFIDFEFPHVTLAVWTAFEGFLKNTVKGKLNPFTLTDNSESPAFVKTVRFQPATILKIPEPYTDPAAPYFTVRGTVQVEPA